MTSIRRLIMFVLGTVCFAGCAKDNPFAAEFIFDSPSPAIIYPQAKENLVIPFEVESAFSIDSVAVNEHPDITCLLSFSPLTKKGELCLRTAQPFAETIELEMTAYSSGVGKKDVLLLDCARILADRMDMQYVGCKGGTVCYEVLSNVPYTAALSDNLITHVTLERNGDNLQVTFPANTRGSFIEGSIILTAEKESSLSRYLAVTQECITEGSESDKAVLEKIYSSLDGKNWREQGYEGYKMYGYWCTEEPVSKWLGVTLNSSGRVVALNLSWNRTISGELPDAIGDLPYLKLLEVNGCDLHGALPGSLCNLRRLLVIDLSDNRLSGFLSDTDLGDALATVTQLDLHGNLLSGGVPEWLSRMKQSENRKLWIYDNHFSGHIPDEVCSMDLWTRYVPDGSGMTAGEKNKQQKDSYALWTGNRPENTVWVTDHWEWDGK